MAEIDRIVVLDIERDGSSSTTAEQEMVILRNDLASTDPTKGAGMVGYRSSESYSDETVGKALTDIESNMSAVEDSASQALTKSNEALAKATTAESRIDNALLKGNNLSDLANKVAAIENLGAIPSGDSSVNPADSKIPRAGSDGTIAQEWVKDLKFTLSSLKKAIDDLRYPDGIVPDIDWDFTAQALPTGFNFNRGSIATYCNKDGYLITAPAGQPIFEWDYSAGKVLGLRREYPSTNIMSYSTYTPTYWGSGSMDRSILEDYGVAPDNSRTSSFITTTTVDGNTPYVGRRQIGWIAGKQYTASIFFKKNPVMAGRKIRLILHSEVFGQNKNLYFDIGTAEIHAHSTPESSPKNFGIIEYANGWYRVWMTDVVKEDFSGTGWGPIVWYADSIMPGEGTEFWGMQIEEGTVMTSFIQTSGSQVTRVADSIEYQKEGILSNNEVTLLVDVNKSYVPEGTTPSASGFGVVIGEKNEYLNYVGMVYNSTSISPTNSQLYYRYPDNGDGQTGGAINFSSMVDPNERRIRTVVSLKPAEVVRASTNGYSVITSSFIGTHDLFSRANKLTFGSSTTGTGGSTSFFGYIEKFQLYNRVLSNEKLQELSAN